MRTDNALRSETFRPTRLTSQTINYNNIIIRIGGYTMKLSLSAPSLQASGNLWVKVTFTCLIFKGHGSKFNKNILGSA